MTKAKDLKTGDEFLYNGEIHRVTVNEAGIYPERKIFTYVITRPRTAPLIFWFPENEEITLRGTE